MTSEPDAMASAPVTLSLKRIAQWSARQAMGDTTTRQSHAREQAATGAHMCGDGSSKSSASSCCHDSLLVLASLPMADVLPEGTPEDIKALLWHRPPFSINGIQTLIESPHQANGVKHTSICVYVYTYIHL